MKQKYKLLDLFSGAGGCAKGYHDAGFEVTGIDIVARSNYPYKFIQADAMEILKDVDFLKQYDVIHASCPCQHYSKLKHLSGNTEKWESEHVDLIGETRELLKKADVFYVLENVENSPLINPIKLYGSQFPNLYTQRPRLFESNIPLKEPVNPKVKHKTGKLGYGPAEDGFITVAGIRPQRGMNEVQTRLYYGFALGGIDWMSLEELTQAIPPAYTEFIGKQIIEYLDIQKEIEKGEQMSQIQQILLSQEFIDLVRKYMVF